MKKLLSVFIALAMLLSVTVIFASCGSEKETVNGKTPAQALLGVMSETTDNMKITGESNTKLGFGGIVLEIPERSTFVKLGSKYYFNSSLLSTEEKFDNASTSLWYDEGIVAVLGLGTMKTGVKLDLDVLSLVPLLMTYVQRAADKNDSASPLETVEKAFVLILDAILGDAGFKSENGGYTVSKTITLDEDLIRRLEEAGKEISKLLDSDDQEGTPNPDEEEDYAAIVKEIKEFLDINEFTLTVKFDKDLNITSYDLVASLKIKIPAEYVKLIMERAMDALTSKRDSYYDDEADYVDEDAPETIMPGGSDEKPEEYISFDIKTTVKYTVERTASEKDIPEVPQDVELIDLKDVLSERFDIDLDTIITLMKYLSEGNSPFGDLDNGVVFG